MVARIVVKAKQLQPENPDFGCGLGQVLDQLKEEGYVFICGADIDSDVIIASINHKVYN